MEVYWNQTTEFVRDYWPVAAYMSCLLLGVAFLLWWSSRPHRWEQGSEMDPVTEKRINRITANYLTDALLQATVDGKLTSEEAALIGTRVGRILGIPGLLPQKIVPQQPLKEELQAKRQKKVVVVCKRVLTESPFDKFLRKLKPTTPNQRSNGNG